jgi:hypothetical protein
MNHKIKAAPRLLPLKRHKMVETEMLGHKSSKSSLAKRNELITRHSCRWSSTKAGVVGHEAGSQATPQGSPIAHVERAAELMDRIHNILLFGLVQDELAAISRGFRFICAANKFPVRFWSFYLGTLWPSASKSKISMRLMCLFANPAILWHNAAQSDSQSPVERRDPHS